MSDYIVFDISTGEIIRTGSCPRSILPIQIINDNEWVMEGKADDVCDVINISTGEVMKDFKTSRRAIEENRKAKQIAEAPVRKIEALIKNKMNNLLRQMAIDALIAEGKIEVE